MKPESATLSPRPAAERIHAGIRTTAGDRAARLASVSGDARLDSARSQPKPAPRQLVGSVFAEQVAAMPPLLAEGAEGEFSAIAPDVADVHLATARTDLIQLLKTPHPEGNSA